MTEGADAKAAIAGVFDRAAGSYDQLGVGFFRPAGSDLVAAACLAPGERVLDVGCGRGASLFPAAAAVGPTGQVTGLDLAPAMVAATSAEARTRGLDQVVVRIGDAEAPDVPDASVDVVLAGLVIFFLPDARAAVRAYRRVLRRGGRLSMSTFVENHPGERRLIGSLTDALTPFLPAAPAPPPDGPPPPHERLRTRQSLSDLLAGAGFVDVRFTERNYPLRFADPKQYWRWLWSSGTRGLLETVPADRLPEAEAAVIAGFAALRPGELSLGIRLTTAIAG